MTAELFFFYALNVTLCLFAIGVLLFVRLPSHWSKDDGNNPES